MNDIFIFQFIIKFTLNQQVGFLCIFLFQFLCFLIFFIKVVYLYKISYVNYFNYQKLEDYKEHMEENIPFRILRKLKPIAISRTSQNLLRPIFRNRGQQKAENSIMNQNVTQYQYMLKDPHTKQNYIDWATNLRGYQQIQQKQNIGCDPPSVYYKQTKIQQIRANNKQQSITQHINTAQFSQYFGKGSVSIPEQQMSFLSHLRQIKIKDCNKNQQNQIHDKKFQNFGAKKCESLPKILKKKAIKKLKNMSIDDFEDRLDGSHKFPQYSYKILKQKNSALINSLILNHSSISLPGIAWSVGLRSY